MSLYFFFFFQAEDGIRDLTVTGVQTCALPICNGGPAAPPFVGTAYRCEASISDFGDFAFADPLFDSAGFAPGCESEASGTPIITDIGPETTEPIEVRLLRDEPAVNGENIGITRLEVWVR